MCMIAWAARSLFGESTNISGDTSLLARITAQGALVKIALMTGSSQLKSSVFVGGPNRRKRKIARVLGALLQGKRQ